MIAQKRFTKLQFPIENKSIPNLQSIQLTKFQKGTRKANDKIRQGEKLFKFDLILQFSIHKTSDIKIL